MPTIRPPIAGRAHTGSGSRAKRVSQNDEVLIHSSPSGAQTTPSANKASMRSGS